jgi:hypothetical protein
MNTARVVSSRNFRPLSSIRRKSSCSGQGFPVPHHPGPKGQGYSVISRSKIATMSAKRISFGGLARRYPPPGPVTPRVKPTDAASLNNFRRQGGRNLPRPTHFRRRDPRCVRRMLLCQVTHRRDRLPGQFSITKHALPYPHESSFPRTKQMKSFISLSESCPLRGAFNLGLQSARLRTCKMSATSSARFVESPKNRTFR